MTPNFDETLLTSEHGSMARVRVLLAKPGLDGHERGAKIVARALRDAGFEVIYTGLRQTPEVIARTALQEDAQIICLSILSGAHLSLCKRLHDALEAEDMDIPVVVGGIIPEEDIPELTRLGVRAVFGPGSQLSEICHTVSLIAESESYGH
jgi:methylmalonyl-CoA mutase C-terminal domain/subunit